jgi:hypothetical protein
MLLRPQQEAPTRPYDLNSAAPSGLLALRLWLESLGYLVDTTGDSDFWVPGNADLFFVYPNQGAIYTESEARQLSRWVARGHTLVIVGPTADDVNLFLTFGVRPLTPALSGSDPPRQQQPLLPDAPAVLERTRPGPALNLGRTAGVVPVLATADGNVTAAVERRGDGTVWYLSPRHALINEDLAERGQGVILPALLRTVPAGGKVYFDTYHLFGPKPDANREPERLRSLQDWLWGTPTGWAVLFTAAAVLVYLLLAGRRLGPALPAEAGTRRREAAEFVQAMAALHRRARQPGMVGRYHRRRLKAGLGHTFHLSPDLSDGEFLRRLTEAGANLSPDRLAAIARLLEGLSGEPDEARLVWLVAEVDEVLERELSCPYPSSLPA